MSHSSLYSNFQKEFKGHLILAGDEKYDNARQLWNGLYEKYPAAIAYCKIPSDVVTAINFVRENQLIFSVRGGGHDYAGNSVCEDGLVIDLSPMNKVEIDPGLLTAAVQGGATVGEFDAEAQKFGLATPTGTVSTIGIGGLTLGGGSGYLSRRFGMTLDNLISAEIVTAEGKIVTARETENQDLFWAVRGGGGNFGVVTSFKFKLHEVGPQVLSYQAFYPFEDSEEVLKFYREFMQTAPAELQCYAFLMNVPPVEPFPKEFYGQTTCALIACYSGNPEDGEAVIKSLQDFGKPFLKFQQPVEYTAIQKSFDAGMPKGLRWFTKAHYLNDLNENVINVFKQFTKSLPGNYTMAYLEPMGGAANKIAPSATAFPHREAAYSVHIFPGWDDKAEDEKNIKWAKDFHKAIASEATGGVYLNLLSHDEKDRIKAAYGENYQRLVQIKKKWDPKNLFRRNHNIPPAA